MSGRQGRPPTDDPKKSDKVDLRLPKGVRALVKAQADKDNRSTNGQIVHYVQVGLAGIDATTLANAVRRIQEDLNDLRSRLLDKE